VSIVVDASVAACWCLPDEYSEIAETALEAAMLGAMVVPGLFAYELENVLLVNERRKRISALQAREGMALIARLTIDVDLGFTRETLLHIARRHGLSVYDAAYVELALRQQLPLATLDRKLASAAMAEGLEVVA